MGPKRKAERKTNSSRSSSSKEPTVGGIGNDVPASAGYLISCDVPTKQYIQHLNDVKTKDKQFIIEDLDAEHLLVKAKARVEIEAEVERWMDDVSVIKIYDYFYYQYRV